MKDCSFKMSCPLSHTQKPFFSFPSLFLGKYKSYPISSDIRRRRMRGAFFSTYFLRTYVWYFWNFFKIGLHFVSVLIIIETMPLWFIASHYCFHFSLCYFTCLTSVYCCVSCLRSIFDGGLDIIWSNSKWIIVKSLFCRLFRFSSQRIVSVYFFLFFLIRFYKESNCRVGLKCLDLFGAYIYCIKINIIIIYFTQTILFRPPHSHKMNAWRELWLCGGRGAWRHYIHRESSFMNFGALSFLYILLIVVFVLALSCLVGWYRLSDLIRWQWRIKSALFWNFWK